MQTLNGAKGTRSGSLQPRNTSDGRFQTITDSYFTRNRNTAANPIEIEELRNHYKFHKGTTYSIGN